jgi:hypothetical protein
VTKAQIRAEIFRRLREASSAPVFWSVADVNQSIDEGYQEIADATEWFEHNVTIDLPSRTPRFDVRQFTQYEFLISGPAFNVFTNRWMYPVTARMLDQGDREWENRLAEPEAVMVRGIWWLTYWPLPASNTTSVKQYYRGIPAAILDAASPAFPEQYHYGLVEYALFDLWAQDAESDLAYSAWKSYLQYESELAAYTNGRLGIPKGSAMRESTAD